MDEIIYPCTRNEQGLSLYPVAECSHQALIESPETFLKLLARLHRQLADAEPAHLRTSGTLEVPHGAPLSPCTQLCYHVPPPCIPGPRQAHLQLSLQYKERISTYTHSIIS